MKWLSKPKKTYLSLKNKNMYKVRAKFTCTAIEKSLHWDRSKGNLYKAKFAVVTANSDENKSFFDATPSGTIEMSTIKEDHFEVGKNYFIDFTAE